MTTVNGMTAEAMIAIRDNVVVGGVVNGSGHLILTKYDGSTIDAGPVIGPTGSPGATATQLNDLLPVNSIIEYNGTTPPNAKWLAMTGQTVTNAQTTYPDWWAVLPAAQKSGANALMPDTRGRVSIGYNSGDTDFDTIAETGGAKTHVLTQAELPAVGVTVNPPATAVTGSTGTESVNHTHSIAVPGGDALLYGDGTHIGFQAGSSYSLLFPEGTPISNPTTGNESVPHTHPAGSLTVDIAQFNSGNMGSGAAMSLVQPYIVFCKMIKVAI